MKLLLKYGNINEYWRKFHSLIEEEEEDDETVLEWWGSRCQHSCCLQFKHKYLYKPEQGRQKGISWGKTMARDGRRGAVETIANKEIQRLEIK